MARPAIAEINLTALIHNYQLAEQLSGPGQCVPVVKANAYGHGAIEVAKVLAKVAPALGVACIEEAMQLRDAGISTPILLLEGPFTADEIPIAAEQHFWMMLSNAEQVDWVCQLDLAASTGLANKKFVAWLKVDTGMHRLGVPVDQAEACYRQLQACKHVAPDSVIATHFASADELGNPSADVQLQRIQQLNESLQAPLSLANSPGLLALVESRQQWNRPGFMLYGNSPFTVSQVEADKLKPVMTLKSAVIALHDVSEGDAVGYGETWRAERASRIATVAIGYGDGYPRNAKNGTPVLVNGQRVPLVGRVSMDMITVDVTDLAAVQLGDEVILWGEQITANEVGRWADTIGYEILTRMPLRTPRIYLK